MSGVSAIDILERVPDRFWSVSYDVSAGPGVVVSGELRDRADCHVFAYEVLREFGYDVPGLWSSDLWADQSATRAVSRPEPLDLMLFGPTEDAFGAHVGVYVGEGRVLHLCREVGRPVVWELAEFDARERYRVVVGIKRPTVAR